jgi:hypothetical protein
MTTITLTPEQVASVLAQASGGAAVAPSPTAGPVQVVGTLDKNGAPFHSGDYAAGSGFALEFDVADEEVGAKTLTFGQSGSLGGSMKTVTLEKDGVVIPVSGSRPQNSASILVGFGNPSLPNYLAPGRWLVRVVFNDPGAAVVVLG